jgi:hypothetical protein
MRLVDRVRSLVAALRASAALGRASRKQRERKPSDALAAALEGLTILRRPYVRRSNPPEGAALVSLVALAETIAWELKVPGAKQQDVADALAHLRTLDSGHSPPELCSYIPFLESRLAAFDHPAA